MFRQKTRFLVAACRAAGWMVAAAACLTGCARSVVTTEVQKDGSWKRTLKLYAAAPAPEGEQGGAPIPGSETLDRAFVLVKGPEWKTSRALEKDPNAEKAQENPFGGMGKTEVFTAERTMGAGETIDHDVSLKSSDAAMKASVVVNTVRVKEIAPGRFEYREILRWKGPKTEPLQMHNIPVTDAKMLQEIKTLLPPALATPKKMQALAQHLTQGMWRLMFGPNDPLIADMFQLMMFPDMIVPKMTRSFNLLFYRALEQTYGAALSEEKRREITRRMAQAQVNALKGQASEKAAAGPPDPNAAQNKEGTFVAMTYTVRMPGRIVEANGEIDPIMNEVYWTFYSPAAMAGDVELRAVCDLNPAP